MSAWLVSDRHLDALVQARALANAETFAHLEERKSDDELGRWLKRANAESVFALYRGRHNSAVDDGAIRAYRYRARPPWTIVELMKAIDCYACQACETREWETSDVRAFCTTLRARLVELLPGYDAAPWGIESDGPMLGAELRAAHAAHTLPQNGRASR